MYLKKIEKFKSKMRGEINSQEGIFTVPNQSLTAQQILSLYQQGRVATGFKAAYMNENEDYIPDFSKMDRIEMEEYRRKQLKKIQKLQEDKKKLDEQHLTEMQRVKQLTVEMEEQKMQQFFLEKFNKNKLDNSD